MFIELVRDGKAFRLLQRMTEYGDPCPIAHASPEHYGEALRLAQAEARRRGANWVVLNRTQKVRP